ncbi:MAG: phosphoribosyl-AMP cyclohydrolase [Candidatus Omnitrophota bacterium]|nr:MAG: phosphoribosyl-AMP cyclohydrolase [Candidatus Omnitrophota bacterium]
MQDTEILDKLKYNQQGLIPAIVQDYKNGDVLMLAYMNKDSLQKTIDTGLATYWSRSRKCYWVKGETSGHFQKIQQIYFDCDYDTLLLKIEQIGAACHTGQRSCFYRKLLKD